jgi:hypothetical protein
LSNKNVLNYIDPETSKVKQLLPMPKVVVDANREAENNEKSRISALAQRYNLF